MEINGMQLDDAVVAAARERFELSRNRRMKSKFGFDEYLTRFSNSCNSFQAIADEEGLTREMIRVTYNRYFRRLLPGKKTGNKRRTVCHLKQAAVMAYEAPEDPVLRSIFESARSADCEVKLIRSFRTTNAFKSRAVTIDGTPHAVHCITAEWQVPHSYRSYGRVNLTMSRLLRYRRIIIFVDVPNFTRRVFIIPSKVFLDQWGDNPKGSKMFYAPLEKSSADRNPRVPINWWRYENTWRSQRPSLSIN